MLLSATCRVLGVPTFTLTKAVCISAVLPRDIEPGVGDVQHTLLLLAMPSLLALALPCGPAFALNYQILVTSAMASSYLLTQNIASDLSEKKSSVLLDAIRAAAAAAMLVGTELVAGIPIETPHGLAASVVCVLSLVWGRYQSFSVSTAQPEVDVLVERQREARRSRRSWDSRLSWRLRKRADARTKEK